jgi:hypothetical protein
VPGSGRKKGTANHSSQKLRLKIHRLGKPLERVCQVARGELVIDGLSQGDALKMLFKAVVPELRGEIVSGPDDGPVVTVNLQQDAQRLAAAFAEQPAEVNGEVPTGKLTGDLLEASKVVAFASEIAKRSNGVASLGVSDGMREIAPMSTTPKPQDRTVGPSEAAVESVRKGTQNEKAGGRLTAARDGIEAPLPQKSENENSGSAESEIPPPEAPEVGFRLRFVMSDWFVECKPPDRPNLPNIYELRSAAGLARRASFDVCMELLRKQLGDDPGAWLMEPVKQDVGSHLNMREQTIVQPPPQVHRGHENRKRRPR